MEQGFWTPSFVAAGSIAALLAVRAFFFRFLHRWALRTVSGREEIIATALKTPSLYWCIAIGLYLGLAVSGFHERYVFFINRSIYIIVIFSITIALANLSGRFLTSYIQRTNLPIPATGLVHGIVKGVIVAVGLLIILGVLGISVAPLITALGVGGLAVALALQDTLANLFAGIHILMERSIRVGDYIRLETGQEGYVEDITWRTTRVRMIPNNTVIIPNSKLSQSVVVNYYLPDRPMQVQVLLKADYSSDPDKVERVVLDEAVKATSEVPGLRMDPRPSVRFSPGFGDSLLEFTLTCTVDEYSDQQPVQHELRKRVLRRFREEGIGMQPPQKILCILKEEEREPAA